MMKFGKTFKDGRINIEDTIDGLTKSLFIAVTAKSETDTSELQQHIWGQLSAYRDILEKLNNTENK